MKMRQPPLHSFMLCALLSPLFNGLFTTKPTPVHAYLSRNTYRGLPSTIPIQAIYQFGDSLSDTGNVIRERNGGTLNYARLPYGITFFHRATGRCSDGLLMVDYFAMFFHLPLLNPILAKGSDFTHGANFAVAGATALGPDTLATINVSATVTYSSLSVQLRWFKAHLQSICFTPTECRERLRKSLVIMGEIGGNDYNFAFSHGRSMAEVYQLVPRVVQAIKDAVQEVIRYGAMNIVVPGNLPIGCVPLYLVQFKTDERWKYDDLNCLKEYNQFSQFHNAKLIEAIGELQQHYPHVNIVYGDYYSAFTWVLRHAPALGFEKDGPEKACCAEGHNPYNYNLGKGCGSPGVPVCPDPTKRVNWDGIHMTQQGNKYVAMWLLRHFVPALQRRTVVPGRRRVVPGRRRVHGRRVHG